MGGETPKEQAELPLEKAEKQTDEKERKGKEVHEGNAKIDLASGRDGEQVMTTTNEREMTSLRRVATSMETR